MSSRPARAARIKASQQIAAGSQSVASTSAAASAASAAAAGRNRAAQQSASRRNVAFKRKPPSKAPELRLTTHTVECVVEDNFRVLRVGDAVSIRDVDDRCRYYALIDALLVGNDARRWARLRWLVPYHDAVQRRTNGPPYPWAPNDYALGPLDRHRLYGTNALELVATARRLATVAPQLARVHNVFA